MCGVHVRKCSRLYRSCRERERVAGFYTVLCPVYIFIYLFINLFGNEGQNIYITIYKKYTIIIYEGSV